MQKNQHDFFFQFIQNQMTYRSLLCLNGHLPEKSFFQRLPLPLIAADGAANLLTEQGVDPHLIIGDLDSVYPQVQERYPCLKISDQNSSDFQKALSYLRKNNLLPAIVLGINGGYLDHILCNITLLAQDNCILYDPPHIIGYFLSKGCYHYTTLPLMSKLSLIGAPSAVITSKGLKWELRNHFLELWGKNSFFNRTFSNEITLEISKGRLLFLLYLQSIEDAGEKTVV